MDEDRRERRFREGMLDSLMRKLILSCLLPYEWMTYSRIVPSLRDLKDSRLIDPQSLFEDLERLVPA